MTIHNLRTSMSMSSSTRTSIICEVKLLAHFEHMLSYAFGKARRNLKGKSRWYYVVCITVKKVNRMD